MSGPHPLGISLGRQHPTHVDRFGVCVFVSLTISDFELLGGSCRYDGELLRYGATETRPPGGTRTIVANDNRSN